MDPQQWLLDRFPNCRALDENWTFERYDYPENVRQWIRDNWVKVSDNNGGTYHEPTYHREKFPHLYEKENPEESKDEKEDPPKEGQEFAQAYKETEFYEWLQKHNYIEDAIQLYHTYFMFDIIPQKPPVKLDSKPYQISNLKTILERNNFIFLK